MSIRAVTDEADVAVGTFYNHFDDVEAAQAEMISSIRNIGSAAISHISSPEQFLSSILTFGRIVGSEPRAGRVVAEAIGTELWPTGVLLDDLADVIETGQREGRFTTSVAIAELTAQVGGVMRDLFARMLDSTTPQPEPGDVLEACRRMLGDTGPAVAEEQPIDLQFPEWMLLDPPLGAAGAAAPN